MLPEKVMWTDGQAVSPVHFQQQDRYVDAQLRFRGEMLHGYPWGFTEFVIDEQYLGLGKIVIAQARGILPDGTLFEIGHGHEALTLDIPPGVSNRRVVLALPLTIAGGSEAKDPETLGVSTRHLRTPVQIRDYNVYRDKNSREVAITCGRYNLQLMFEDDSDLSGYVAMPVIHIIECRQDLTVLLDKECQPTYLHMQASPVLSGYLTEMIGLVSHRGDHLAMRVGSAGHTGAAEIADFILLQCINRFEPLFRHMEQTPRLHPEEFYRFLLALAGELATFTEPSKRPQALPEYNHERQFECFASLMQQARYSLSMVLEQHAVRLTIQQRKDNVKLAPIHDKKLLGTAVFVLVAQADMDVESLHNLLPRQIKIGTPENIRELVNAHLPGVKIRPLPVAPRQIPFHAGKSYFQLEFTSQQRAQLETSTGCAIHVSGTFPGLQMELWAIKE